MARSRNGQIKQWTKFAGKEPRSSIAEEGRNIRIAYHTAASGDVSRSFVYLGERNFDAATRFLAAVDGDLKKLSVMPGMGAMREFGHSALSGIRSWPVSGFGNYLIFYKVRGDVLEFLRLIHGAQDIESALLSP